VTRDGSTRTSRIGPAVALADILETDWDAQLFRGPNALAKMLGWTSYHTLRSRGSKSGYPDRTLVRDRILFVELKREKTQPTPDQIMWLDKLAGAGGEVYLWRPSDLDEIARVLTARKRPYTPGEIVYVDHGAYPPTFWCPGSQWFAGQGRADTAERARAHPD
jgi:hypothetical protein